MAPKTNDPSPQPQFPGRHGNAVFVFGLGLGCFMMGCLISVCVLSASCMYTDSSHTHTHRGGGGRGTERECLFDGTFIHSAKFHCVCLRERERQRQREKKETKEKKRKKRNKGQNETGKYKPKQASKIISLQAVMTLTEGQKCNKLDIAVCQADQSNLQ